MDSGDKERVAYDKLAYYLLLFAKKHVDDKRSSLDHFLKKLIEGKLQLKLSTPNKIQLATIELMIFDFISMIYGVLSSSLDDDTAYRTADLFREHLCDNYRLFPAINEQTNLLYEHISQRLAQYTAAKDRGLSPGDSISKLGREATLTIFGEDFVYDFDVRMKLVNRHTALILTTRELINKVLIRECKED